MAQGHHDEALRMHHRALEIQKALPKDEQKNMATTYANLAQAWHGRGDFDEALKMYEKAALISEQFYGTDHQATAPIYSSIGSCLLLQGKHAEALAYFQQALKVFKAKSGENHPDTAKTYSDIGRIYHGQGKYADALVMQDKAIAIQETLLGNHVHTVRSIALLRLKTSIFARVFLAYSSFVSMSSSCSSFVSIVWCVPWTWSRPQATLTRPNRFRPRVTTWLL
jgi:tetratricopeptide (TPR) repeat protein